MQIVTNINRRWKLERARYSVSTEYSTNKNDERLSISFIWQPKKEETNKVAISVRWQLVRKSIDEYIKTARDG